MTATPTGITLALLLVSAPLLATDTPAADSGRKLVYACDGGRTVTAVHDGAESDHARVMVSVDGDPAVQNIEMHYVMAANGEKASSGKLVWWTRGDEGFLANEDPPAGDGEVVIGGCRDVAAEH